MANKSMAVWCVSRAGQPTDFEAHINFWRLVGAAPFASKNPQVSDFLEVGILIDQPQHVGQVKIFVPAKIERSAVRDCSRYFKEPMIAQGIFNEVVGSKGAGPHAPRAIELSKLGGGIFCHIHGFLAINSEIDASELDIVHHPEGTVLTILERAVDEICGAAGSTDKAYFRLRIYLKAEEWIIKVIRPPVDQPFQTSFEEITYVDFRLNEARTLPARVETMMRTDHAGANPLKLVAFLTATPIESTIAESSKQYKLRVLEWSIWSHYVEHALPEDMIIYHWKRDDSPIQDFSAFVKLGARRTSWRIVWTYLLVAFLFGILGNLAASSVEKSFEGRPETVPRPFVAPNSPSRIDPATRTSPQASPRVPLSPVPNAPSAALQTPVRDKK